MKKIVSICFIIFFTGNSCKKSSSDGLPPPPGNPNNEFKATVTIKNSPAYSLIATGSSTAYMKLTHPTGEVVTIVSGHNSQGKIDIIIVNINLPGTYIIGTGSGSPGDKYIVGRFEIGNALVAGWEYFSVQPPPPPSGTITLDEVTANSIRGSFSMTCTGGTGTVQITNGTFKGIF